MACCGVRRWQQGLKTERDGKVENEALRGSCARDQLPQPSHPSILTLIGYAARTRPRTRTEPEPEPFNPHAIGNAASLLESFWRSSS